MNIQVEETDDGVVAITDSNKEISGRGVDPKSAVDDLFAKLSGGKGDIKAHVGRKGADDKRTLSLPASSIRVGDSQLRELVDFLGWASAYPESAITISLRKE